MISKATLQGAFISGITVILKPRLLTEHGFPENQIQQFGTIAIAIYTLFKSAVAFYSKKVYKKILPVILIVVSILSYFLFTYSFKMNQAGSHSIFIVTSCILALLSYFAFEYSCGYKTNTLFKKNSRRHNLRNYNLCHGKFRNIWG